MIQERVSKILKLLIDIFGTDGPIAYEEDKNGRKRYYYCCYHCNEYKQSLFAHASSKNVTCFSEQNERKFFSFLQSFMLRIWSYVSTLDKSKHVPGPCYQCQQVYDRIDLHFTNPPHKYTPGSKELQKKIVKVT